MSAAASPAPTRPGILVLGLGGRVVMRIAAAVNPDATGLRTEAGEVVGVVTAQGSLGLLVFGGLASGIVAGIVWVVVSPWIPGTGPRRWLLAMLVTVALGGSLPLPSGHPDLVIPGPD